jgi:hypothetical protein
MSVLPVHLAIEDQLSEAVLRKLLQNSGRGYEVGYAYGRNGYGYLKRTIRGWNRAARSTPFVVLTDLDDGECAPTLIADWMGSVPMHHNLVFRVAVREVESWLLGDRSNLAEYLGVRKNLIPYDPDGLADPKLTLVQVARSSRSAEIKARVVPKARSTAKQGPEYNACLIEFVNHHWDIDEARANSPSLYRATDQLLTFRPKWD